ncbi:MAG TPA: DUF882 domain-containing protein [Methylovirgula sp.]|nr:DUF882 domain-containing protein [Methylovirgula sp.]
MPKPRLSTDLEVCLRRCRLALSHLFASRLPRFSSIASRPAQSQAARLLAGASLVGLSLCILIPSSTESAVANGDTRTIELYHAHTGESISATYLVDGHYDMDVVKKLDWFLRDWRRNEETEMDPRLFDAVWETYREAGATQPIVVLCGYRSPETNAMLRRRSRGVAEHSQHILGKAMDTTMPGMSMEQVREVAMRLQMGGVGYYPSSNFVHIDVGGVRAWPRMTYDQLVRLFPDGKTVHIAADGRTLPGYEEARAELESRGDVSVPPPEHSGNFFAWLFGGMTGGGADEREDQSAASPQPAGSAYVADAQNGQIADTQSAAAAAPAGESTAAANADTAAARPGADQDQADTSAGKSAAETVADSPPPVPPRRPTDLASLDVPMPPVRPVMQLAAAEPQQAETSRPQDLRAPISDLPGIITQGPNDERTTQSLMRSPEPSQSEALAYAPLGQMEGLRSAAHSKHRAQSNPVVPARLDRSDFLSLTRTTETAEMESQTIFGPTLAGIRRAARVETAALSNKLESDYVARFGDAATDLAADHFEGPSVASLDTDKDRLVFLASSGQN